MMSEKYNQTFQEYVDNMRTNASAWGGGPEIIAISNFLQCPIHIYELCAAEGSREFKLQPKALFGSPFFDQRSPMYILSADGRFPNLFPGTQKPDGDHFLALYPCLENDPAAKRGIVSDMKVFLKRFFKYSPSTFESKIKRMVSGLIGGNMISRPIGDNEEFSGWSIPSYDSSTSNLRGGTEAYVGNEFKNERDRILWLHDARKLFGDGK
jgi:hypothetical protein